MFQYNERIRRPAQPVHGVEFAADEEFVPDEEEFAADDMDEEENFSINDIDYLSENVNPGVGPGTYSN